MAILENIIIWTLVLGLMFVAVRPLWRSLKPRNSPACPGGSTSGCAGCPMHADIKVLGACPGLPDPAAKH